MGIFNKKYKVSPEVQERLKKTEGSQIYGRVAVALIHGPKPLFEDLPEGMGEFFLKNDGSGLLILKQNSQGWLSSDEIHFTTLESWSVLEGSPLFNWLDLSDIDEEGMLIETYPWSIALIETQSYSKDPSVREWLEEHYPDLEKFI